MWWTVVTWCIFSLGVATYVVRVSNNDQNNSSSYMHQYQQMEWYSVKSCVQGHHIFGHPLDIGESLLCGREPSNSVDPAIYATAVPFLLTVILPLQYRLCYRFIWTKPILLLHFMALYLKYVFISLKYGGF